MARKQAPAKKQKTPRYNLDMLLQGEVWGSLLIVLGVVTLLAMLSARQGALTSWWIGQLHRVVGNGAALLALLMIGIGLWAMLRGIGRLAAMPRYRPIGAILLLLAVVTAMHMDGSITDAQALQMAQRGEGGGFLGYGLSELFIQAVGYSLAWVLIAALAGLALFLLVGPLLIGAGSIATIWLRQRRDDQELRTGWADSMNGSSVASAGPSWWARLTERLRGLGRGNDDSVHDDEPALVIGGQNGKPARVVGEAPVATPQQTNAGQARGPAPGSAESLIPRIIGGNNRSWRLPDVASVLEEAEDVEISQDDIKERARIIEKTLADFGLPVRVVEANPGPAVTQFGLQPGYRERRKSRDEMRREAEEVLQKRGRRTPSEDQIKEVMENEIEKYERVKIKVSKIQSLTNDLALALSASPIRIEAPVPGRPMVGLEVPNTQKAMVSLRGVLESDTFKQMNSALRVGLGQDTSGQSAVADLARMPHLLVAGATGSGKSVCVNSIIATLLLTHTPDTLRFLMIDPKMVELITYNGIPHLLSPVVVEVEQAVPLLRWATGEMDRRYKLFSKEGARNVDAFNEKIAKRGETTLPYIVVVIDELADLMMAAADDVERYICRLAQMSRATGIHLIIATQRPSVDVVTGLIKANFPSRIAFAVTSQIDSRVILDTPGAEALLGRGDMLFMRPDSSKLERLQGCFVSDAELEKLVRYWKGVRITDGTTGDDGMAPAAANGGLPPMGGFGPQAVTQAPLWEEMIQQQRDAQNSDDLYNDAVDVVRQAGRASVSLLQRRLRIGYSRAARLIDLMEERGVVGPDQGGSMGREVLAESKPTPKPPAHEPRWTGSSDTPVGQPRWASGDTPPWDDEDDEL
ncbi:MAG: DNA translocase FtsK [Anaerolineae bacterium]